jgi:hypothetical protein
MVGIPGFRAAVVLVLSEDKPATEVRREVPHRYRARLAEFIKAV